MHTMLEKAIENDLSIDDWAIIDGVEITDQHKEIVSKALTALETMIEELSPCAVYTEFLVHSRKLGSDMFGTADYIIDSPKGLFVVDFKSGAGIEVEAENNPQLAFYGLAALEQFPAERLVLVIIQPQARSGKMIKTWDIPDVKQFQKYWYHSFGAAKTRAENWEQLPKGQRYTLGDHCKWCPVETICPERAKEIINLFPVIDEEPKDDINHLLEVLKAKDRILDYLKAIEEKAKWRLQTGKQVPGFKLVIGRSTRKWVNEEATIEELLSEYDEDEFLTQKLLPMGKIEKLVGKEFVDKHTIKSTPKAVLVPESDKREAITGLDDFEEIE